MDGVVNLTAVAQSGGEVTAFAVGLVMAGVPTLFWWLFLRAVRGVDRTLDGMSKKIDLLVQQDTGRQVEIADLRARVVHLEYIVLGRHDPRPSEVR